MYLWAIRIRISGFLRWLAGRFASPPRRLPWKKAAFHYKAGWRAERLRYEAQSRLLLFVLNQITDDQLIEVRRGESWLDEAKKITSPGGKA